MNDVFNLFFHGGDGSSINTIELLLILLIAFAIGQVIAWVNMYTHHGLSYSKGFTASLVVITIMVAMVMMLLGTNVAMAFGLLGVLGVVRYRNVLKDTRDTTYILWCIVEGMAVGTHNFGPAIMLCIVVTLVQFYLRVTSFGGRHKYDVVLTVRLAADDAAVMPAVKTVIKKYSSRAAMDRLRHLPEEGQEDMSYHLLLRDPSRSRHLLSELKSTQGVSHVTLFHRDDEAEI